MNIHFIKSSEKKEIMKKIGDDFGIDELPYLLIESGKEKIRGFSGHLSKDEIKEISSILRVESMGIYLLRKENNELRLSLDATHLLRDKIKKSIKLSDIQAKEWTKGADIEMKTERGVKVIRQDSLFLGCGKSNTEKIFNYVPEDRRIRK